MADESASLDAIEAELTELAAHINSGTARFLALVAEFDARMGWAEWGCRSCAHWLAHHCGVSPVTARRMDHDLAVHGLLSTERFSVLDDVRPEA